MSTLPDVPATAEDQQAWRPRYHYSPARNWMNDPNGLFYLDGLYHLYYQYNPAGSQWGNMSWGHAVSNDLLSWNEQDVAIAASPERMVFSGTVVVDYDNTSGFAPARFTVPPVLAFYTGFDPVSTIQSQYLAYSLDAGAHFTDYAANPVIDIQSTEFRDPKVFWHAPGRHWVMLVVAALLQQVWFYTSGNLKDWVKVSEFGPAGSSDGNIWEVPDLFELAVEGDAKTSRWVLIVSVNRGSLWGGSGVQYFTGHFDGMQFVADDHGLKQSTASDVSQITLWADFGRDFYAPITFANMPDGRRVWMGWVNNWEYAALVPTEPWRGQMSAPRELSLIQSPAGLRLCQRPVSELRRRIDAAPVVFERRGTGREIEALLAETPVGGRQLHLNLQVDLSELQGEFGLRVYAEEGEGVKVGFDVEANAYFVDRCSLRSRLQAGQERHIGRRVANSPVITLDVWIDGCVLELYGDEGTVAISDMVFMPSTSCGVQWLRGNSDPSSVSLKIATL